MNNIRVNLKTYFDQEERSAMISQRFQTKLDPAPSNKPKHDPYETIKIIQKNLLSDFDEIIAEKKIYACLFHTDINSPLYHIEKLSELVGKAKAIIKSKVYKIDRRTALQNAIDLFSRVKDRLSLGILDDLRNASHKRQSSETNTQYDVSSRFERNCSSNEAFKRNVRDSLNLNRQRLGHDVPETLSEPSDKCESKSSEDMDYCGNSWSRKSSTSTQFSSSNPMQDNSTNGTWANYRSNQMFSAAICISPPLPRVTPLFRNSVQTNDCSATPCISPPLPSATPLYTSWNAPPLPQKSPDLKPPPPKESRRIDDLIYGHYPTPNVHLNELESIQATLQNLGNFENYGGKSSDSSESDCATKHYYYVDGELTEFTPPKNNKPNQSVDSAETSHTSSKSENNDWKFLKLTQENVAKFEKMQKAGEKVEATKRKIDAVDDKKVDNTNPKKTKIDEPKKIRKIKLVREKKLYVKESPEIYKIVKKYKK